MPASGALFVLLFAIGTGAEEDPADRLVVLKSQRKLQLFRNGRVFKWYRIALGSQPVGHKERQGDSRTPEGVYRIESRNPRSRFHRSLRISYPNAQDRKNARQKGLHPGGDIMIHGLPNGMGGVGAQHSRRDWTDGCIAVTNEEIEEIWRLVRNGTIIEIRP